MEFQVKHEKMLWHLCALITLKCVGFANSKDAEEQRENASNYYKAIKTTSLRESLCKL